MSAPLQIRKLKIGDYPQGIATSQDVQRLFQALNPILEGAKTLSNNGVSITQNLDSQLVSFQVTTPSTDWTDLTLAGGAVNVGGTYPNLGFRVNALGETWLRGAITTLPALGTTLATLPAAATPILRYRFAVDSNGVYGSIEVQPQTNGTANIIQIAGGIGANPLHINASFPSVSNSAGFYSSFPIQVRTKDGRQPLGVFLLFCNDSQNANPPNTPNSGGTPSILTTGLQWSYLQSGTGQSFISIDGIPGLALGRTYDVSVLVVY